MRPDSLTEVLEGALIALIGLCYETGAPASPAQLMRASRNQPLVSRYLYTAFVKRPTAIVEQLLRPSQVWEPTDLAAEHDVLWMLCLAAAASLHVILVMVLSRS